MRAGNQTCALVQRAAVICGAMVLIASSGCSVAGWAGNVIAGPGTEAEVTGEYRGLEGKTVAVVVTAPPHTLLRQPNMPLLVAKALSGQLSQQLPTITIVDPTQVIAFQNQNPYWSTLPYGDLARRLGADRLVLIDVVSYSTQDPKNKHVWRGTMTANVNVAEGDSANPDAFVYTNAVGAGYPSRPIPLLDSDEQTIQLGMLKLFSHRVTGLFYDHKEARR